MNTSFDARNPDLEFYSKKRCTRKGLFSFDIWSDLGYFVARKVDGGVAWPLYGKGVFEPAYLRLVKTGSIVFK
jgi:hypothetical protein